MKLTKSELEIMNVLWKAERPLSRAEILELSEDKTWKDNSIHILLNGMLKKGAIQGDGFVRSGKVWGRLYAPTIVIGEYYRENLFSPAVRKPILFFWQPWSMTTTCLTRRWISWRKSCASAENA